MIWIKRPHSPYFARITNPNFEINQNMFDLGTVFLIDGQDFKKDSPEFRKAFAAVMLWEQLQND